jgi:hypothetical protein
VIDCAILAVQYSLLLAVFVTISIFLLSLNLFILVNMEEVLDPSALVGLIPAVNSEIPISTSTQSADNVIEKLQNLIDKTVLDLGLKSHPHTSSVDRKSNSLHF